MADQYAMENNITRETAIRDLLIHEELRDTYQRINRKLNRQRSPQLSAIWIKDSEGQKIILDKYEDVERHLLDLNITHLQQANDTPFAQEDKVIYLGQFGEG